MSKSRANVVKPVVHSDDEALGPRLYAKQEAEAQALYEALGPEIKRPEKTTKSVVAAGAKAKWKANGNPRGCGDWLHVELDSCLGPDGKLEVSSFDALLDANGVKAHRTWNRTSPGWQGRLRMSGRMALQTLVVARGHLVLSDGSKKPAPSDWLQARRGR